MSAEVESTNLTSSLNELKIKEQPTQEIGEDEEDSEEIQKDENAHETNEESNSNNPSDFAVKHPLQNRWALWYDNPPSKTSQQSWADSLKKVVAFDTVEDFWRIFNNIRPASKLAHGANYHLFKDGVEPKWEDDENKKGGKWLVTCKASSKEMLDKWWLWLVLACIGENFDEENEIMGCVVSIRKGNDRLALWTKTASNENVQRKIGTQLKRVLELGDNASIGYTVHQDSLKRGSSFNNRSRYEV